MNIVLLEEKDKYKADFIHTVNFIYNLKTLECEDILMDRTTDKANNRVTITLKSSSKNYLSLYYFEDNTVKMFLNGELNACFTIDNLEFKVTYDKDTFLQCISWINSIIQKVYGGRSGVPEHSDLRKCKELEKLMNKTYPTENRKSIPVKNVNVIKSDVLSNMGLSDKSFTDTNEEKSIKNDYGFVTEEEVILSMQEDLENSKCPIIQLLDPTDCIKQLYGHDWIKYEFEGIEILFREIAGSYIFTVYYRDKLQGELPFKDISNHIRAVDRKGNVVTSYDDAFLKYCMLASYLDKIIKLPDVIITKYP